MPADAALRTKVLLCTQSVPRDRLYDDRSFFEAAIRVSMRATSRVTAVTYFGVCEGDLPLAQHYYEGMFILDSARFGGDPDAAGVEVAAIIEKAGATIVAHRPWSDAKLAYPIGDHKKGLYYLVFFSGDGATIGAIGQIVKLNANIVRHLIISHPLALFERMVQLIMDGEAFRHEQVGDMSPIGEEVPDDAVAV